MDENIPRIEQIGNKINDSVVDVLNNYTNNNEKYQYKIGIE